MMRIIRKCIEEKECDVTLYKLDGCGFCDDMADKLDELRIPYETKNVTAGVCKRTGFNSVPQVVINTPLATYVIQDRDKLEQLLGR